MDIVVAALYRRYRPESFAEMIGQSQVTEPLMTALRAGRIGHAYLFSGPRGCGKTTSARILARCLNCAEGPTDTPCGTCPSCIELSRDGGGSLDVVEIDAASHGGVDDARDLRERAVFAPARDRYKVFIIDEAHMVTSAGFNALLKIVEEPPPHVKFVFATTEPEKVIGTIRSRTHHYPFRLIAPAPLIDYVQTLCDEEGVDVEPGVLPLVVRAGGGSVRDTLSILDQLIAGSEENRVTAARAAGLLGFTGEELLDEVVGAFGSHDAAAAFRAADRVVQTGQDPRRFVEDLLERLRDLIVVSATSIDGASAVFRGVPEDQLTRMFENAQRFRPGELSRIADIASEALDRMVGATAPRLQLELMIARSLVALDEVRGTPAVAPSAAAAPQPAVPPQRSTSERTAPPPRATPSAAPDSPSSAPKPAAETVSPAPNTAPEPAASAPNAAPEPVAPAPNAAQTAAQVRDFLRRDSAGTGAAAVPAAEAGPTAEAGRAAEAAPAEPAAPVEPAAHPNAGAAPFGRSISDVLSAEQLASIGSGSSPEGAPAPATAVPSEQVSGASVSSESMSSEPASPEPASAEPTSTESTSTASTSTASTSTEQAPRGPAPANQSPHASGGAAEPDTDADAAEPMGDDAGEAPGGFDDLLELWPELLEEILEQDRDAWNAVRVAQPLSLDGDILAVGFTSRSDLDVFKASGAGPLREVISSAVGITVRYVPRSLPAGGSAPTPPRTADDGDPPAEEPHRGSQNESSPAADDPVARAAQRLSGLNPALNASSPALGPALAAPAWNDPPTAPAHTGDGRDSDTPHAIEPQTEPEPESEPEPQPKPESAPAPQSVSRLDDEPEPEYREPSDPDAEYPESNPTEHSTLR